MAGFIKLQRSQQTQELLRHPHAFILLTVVAYRAQRTETLNTENLAPGEALLGDYRNYGLTETTYRSAKKQLQKWNLATFQGTNKGTIAKLVNNTIYDINLQTTKRTNPQENNEPMTNQPRASHDYQEYKKRRMKEKRGEGEIEADTETTSLPPEDNGPYLNFPPKPQTPAVQPMSEDEKKICHAWARAKNLPGMEALSSRELSHLSQHIGRVLQFYNMDEVLAEIAHTTRPTAGWWLNDLLDRANQKRASFARNETSEDIAAVYEALAQ